MYIMISDLIIKFNRILNKPHPFIFNRYSVLLPLFTSFLILVILKPFEFDTFLTIHLILWSALFAILVGLTVLVCVVIVKKYFPKTIEENWTLKHEASLILFVLAMISLVVYVLFISLNSQTNRVELFKLVVIRTIAISFFPVITLVLYEQYYHQKVIRSQFEKLNQELLKKQHSLHKETPPVSEPTKILLVAENQKGTLQIDLMNLFYIKSDGNYVEIFYKQNQKLQKELMRNSLKAIEEQLSDDLFFRCHNRFLINVNHIQKVDGNARNFDLILEDIEEKIPVSRNKSERLHQLFQKKTDS